MLWIRRVNRPTFTSSRGITRRVAVQFDQIGPFDHTVVNVDHFERGHDDAVAAAGDTPIDEGVNQNYAQFVKKRRYRKPHYWAGKSYPQGSASIPVVGVSWEDARQYCRFKRKRLPTEAEWEKAARGTRGAVFAWGGKTFATGYTVSRESRHKTAVSVRQKTKDISPYGLRFMSGNVREWVSSRYGPYPGTSFSTPRGQRVIRGGSWAKNHQRTRMEQLAEKIGTPPEANAGDEADAGDRSRPWPPAPAHAGQPGIFPSPSRMR